MLLITFLKILFWVLVIRHSIRWVSYHVNHKNKKARVFHGNCRMPFDVEFALMYGINALTKTRFKVKDLSYRKSLAEWKQLLNTCYPAGNDSLNTCLTTQPHPTLITLPLYEHTTLKSPLMDLSANRANPSCGGGVTNGNPGRKPFPLLETGNNNFIPYSKTFAKNNGVISATSLTKIIRFSNLKIPQNAILFPKQTFACTRQIFMVCFHFYFLSAFRHFKRKLLPASRRVTFNLLAH